jgi:hypothetical protein
MAATISKFGPGTLKIGEVGTEIDISCQIEHAQVAWDKTKDDDVTVLCGDVVTGATTRTATLAGHIFQDTGQASGIVQASWGALKGQTVPFQFVPNTADAMAVTGEVTVEPITVGSGEAGANMASDFEWDIVGEPVLAALP